MKRFALLLVLVFAGFADADSYDAVCRVTNTTPERNGDGFAGGSACLVGIHDNRGLLLSAGHIWENGGRGAKVTFPAAPGEWRAKVLRCSQQPDIAVLEIPNPPAVSTPPCVRVARREDGPFTCAGFPWNGRGKLFTTSGPMLGESNGRLTVRAHVISGYSGGAVFNRHGEWVANVCGMTGENTRNMDRVYGYSGRVLDEFVAPYLEVKK